MRSARRRGELDVAVTTLRQMRTEFRAGTALSHLTRGAVERQERPSTWGNTQLGCFEAVFGSGLLRAVARLVVELRSARERGRQVGEKIPVAVTEREMPGVRVSLLERL